MREVIHQALQCPFQGVIRKLFMESKALEFLALKLEQLQAPKKRLIDTPSLRRGDLERVRHAASLLAVDLVKTPDLNELARSVGMCRTKLHRCFRSAYGITPFDYLRNRRLETAMLYLKEGEMNVTEAACAVGYSSPSYFTKAFKKYFGYLPGQCCRTGSSVQ
ncbi:AraC family transcriptional regulator [Dethiosulfatarculus sandiegensis]|uniref:AraC family transcriptional regulator n=2 Tax=Dethiosulfatarculus sandiegensis TaxID=1429043 RepID=A0A0D2JB98_9BACT|nr:AraC family transcriptional regulator [Dethiosulfatarculus sandiegensis]